jgi:hypothetical protein
MENKFVDASQLSNDFMQRWLYSRKGHRKSRWLKKWNRMVERSWKQVNKQKGDNNYGN